MYSENSKKKDQQMNFRKENLDNPTSDNRNMW